LRAAFTQGGREASEVIGLEGEHLLAEALRSGLRLRTVFVRADPDHRSLRRLERLGLPAAVPIVSLNAAVFSSAVETESPQGIAALVETPHFSMGEVLSGPRPLIVIAAAIQDPGNLGTLVRSAEAFGANGVIALPGTVSVWNAKALRGSAGSAFRVPVVAEKSGPAFAALDERKIPIFAAVPQLAESDAVPCTEVNLTSAAAILIGNEGSGLSAELLDRAEGRICIPTPGPVESLNAAVAGSVLLYEAARQRRQGERG